jgi:hypothetical protein
VVGDAELSVSARPKPRQANNQQREHQQVLALFDF